MTRDRGALVALPGGRIVRRIVHTSSDAAYRRDPHYIVVDGALVRVRRTTRRLSTTRTGERVTWEAR